ncbi:MAG: integrase [Methanobrevibacter sp.]|jgi:integrase|nr:integrase [Candidatus Methanovirga basalitermitum]
MTKKTIKNNERKKIMNDHKFQEFIAERNLAQKTIKTYVDALKIYVKINNKSLSALISEADCEEEERIRAKNRQINKRLKHYRQHLIQDKNYGTSTIKEYFTKIKSFYRHFEIEIPYMPPVQLREDHHERYHDIPTIEHIQQALEATNNLLLKSLILFMSSSGTAVNETLHIHVSDFITATNEYHKTNNIDDCLNEIGKQDDVVPLFELVRIKTDYPYYTCCSYEATTMIVKYLRTREKLKPSDFLFNIKNVGMNKLFARLNDKLGWGKVNKYSFFRPHNLRKFNATTIEDISFANTIQGRKADTITETYFKNNPIRIKEKYLEYLPRLTIYKTVVTNLDSAEVKKLKDEFHDALSLKDKKIKDLEDGMYSLRQDLKDLLKEELVNLGLKEK